MTQTVTTGEGRAYVFIAVDHYSGELVGTHASSSASRWEALVYWANSSGRRNTLRRRLR